MTIWLPLFACPECRTPIHASDGTEWPCRDCGRRFEYRSGVYRFLAADRVALAAPFIRQYGAVRAGEGYTAISAERRQQLPEVPEDDRHATEWRVRSESFAHLLDQMPRKNGARVVELGAGNGWLSNRLASAGHHVVAVDRGDDEADGLGACAQYAARFAAVQADFDALPFVPRQFDLAIFSGSLHYSPNPAATLAEAARLLASDGRIAVVDSPMFARSDDGMAMVEEQSSRLRSRHGLSEVLRPGVGFLTYEGLARAAEPLGFRGRFVVSRGPLPWRLGRQISRLRLRRAPAAFGVWVTE